MLGTILAAVLAAGRPVCLAELSADLGIEASALEGMLETLVARGRLRTIRAERLGCGGCPVKSGCFILEMPAPVTYVPAAPPQRGPDVVAARQA